MNTNAKELFAERVINRLSDFSAYQRNCVKNAILEEMTDFVVYTPEEVAEIIKEPLTMLDRFLKAKLMEGCSKNTTKLYKFNITRFIGCTIKPIDEITADDVRNYLNRRVTEGASLVYANNIRDSLSSFFLWIFNEDYITKNPMFKIRRIKCDRGLQPAFSEVEIDAIRRVSNNNPRDIAIVDFLLSTGCRVSEMCNTNITDINFEKKRLNVIGKGNKRRTVYLTDVAVSTLKAYLRTRKDDNAALFVTRKKPNSRISSDGIQALLRKIGAAAHVENVHPHRFRHACCTRLLNRGMSIQDVAKILGHSNVNTTMCYNNTNDEFIENRFHQFSY